MSYPPVVYKQPPFRDIMGGEFVTISHAHEEIHEGDAYVVTLTTTITAGATLSCLFTPPAGDLRIHFVMACEASGNGITVTLYEGADASGGTPLAIFNRNRNSSKTTGMAAVHTPSILSNGTALFTKYLASTKQSGSSEHSTEEFVLKAGTQYLITLTADAGTNPIFNGRADWYETSKGASE